MPSKSSGKAKPSSKSKSENKKSKLKSKVKIGRPRKYKHLIPTKTREVKRDEILVTNVFKRTKECGVGIIVERGGARSSKSYSIAQLLVEKLFAYPQFGRKICVLRKTFPALRISIKPMIYDIITKYGLWDRIREDKMENNLVYGRSFMHFGSLDKPEKIRSSEWNDILLEEANEFTYEDYMNVTLRTSANDFGIQNQLIMNLNPIDAYHWIKEKVIGPDASQPLTKDCIEIHSTYRDNPFLSQSYIDKLEAVKDQDPNYWKIFGEGEWGKLENLVYTWWTTVPEPKEGEIYFGLDFGFTNPSSLVELRQDGKEVYVIERLHSDGLTNSNLIERMKKIIPEHCRSEFPIYADDAEPARIAEINEAGFWCLPSKKDVLDGIDFVKQHHLNIVNGHDDSQFASPNILKEIRAYSYRQDKFGRILEEPVKFNDHAMSAIRYAMYTHNKSRSIANLREIDDVFSFRTKRRYDPDDPFADMRDDF